MGFFPCNISQFNTKLDDENYETTQIEYGDVSGLPLAINDDVSLTSTSAGREQSIIVIQNELKCHFKPIK